MVMDQFSATEIFNTSTLYTGSTKAKINPKKKEFTYSVKWRCFLPIIHLATNIQQLFWKKPIGNTDTFKLMLFFLGNGCSKHLIPEWILTSQHWTTLQKRIQRTRQKDFVNNNLDSNANISGSIVMFIIPLDYFSMENSEIPIIYKF